ncbi:MULTISPECIES: DUF2306 domain-containing protein [Niastella]|uniref:DUF2306 domain-containing protein n=1 Tax=Niastella soli TaxID=2821487 RepID=A0ABS3YWY1_9BACT|nr:DUF2306 domain-containing protein [Niastella soli]MBO9202439.1 DUF2306 domain-containing protein [Niastella soli]
MANTRITTLRKAVSYFFRMLFWLPVTFFSLLLVYNTLPYFSFNKGFGFIQERSLLFQSHLYNACFYIHIFAGVVCITTAVIQFSRYILKRSKAIHRWSGRLYVFVVLFLGAPTGFYLSFFAKGSFWERVLFMFMAVCWFMTTYYGLSTILKKNVLAHKIWMIRSYAMAMTAVTFRIYHIVFFLLNWGHLENYELSLWISVIGNMLFAELIIFRKCRKYLRSFAL